MFRLFPKRYPAIFSDESILSHPIFAGFTPSQFSEIEPYFREISFGADAVLTLSHPDNTLFAVIRNGSVQVHEKLGKNRRENTWNLRQGESFGEPNIVDPGFSVLKCRFTEPADLLVLTHKNFQAMVRKNSSIVNRFYLNLSNIISERLVELNEEYITAYYKTITKAGDDK